MEFKFLVSPGFSSLPDSSCEPAARMLPCWAFSPLPVCRPRPALPVCSSPTSLAKHTPVASGGNENGGKRRVRRSAKKQKAGAFANAIDDMTMKKYGRGYIYYGERKRLGEGVVQEDENEDLEEESDSELLKPDPVLVVGGTGRTGQWITLGLLNQGFNVRVLTRKFERAEKIFGPSGDNVDVFEGDLDDPIKLLDAVDGAAAVVFAASSPWWIPGGMQTVDAKGGSALVDAVRKTKSVKRFVFISAADGSGSRGRAKRITEEKLRNSGLPYVIIRPAELVDDEGGLRNIAMKPSDGDGDESSGQLCRVDLAQVVCQTLVHDRFINGMREEDPDGGFVFPNCVFRVANGNDPFLPDAKFWKVELTRISSAFGNIGQDEVDKIDRDEGKN